MSEAWIEELADDAEAEERTLRSGLAELEQLGDRSYYSTVAVVLAECLRKQGRSDEVAELCASAREYSSPDDLVNFIYLDAIEGYRLAQQGLHEQAQARARDALERAETTDFWAARGDSRLTLAETLALAGRMQDAGQVAAEGLAFYEAKGAVLATVRARERLHALEIPVG